MGFLQRQLEKGELRAMSLLQEEIAAKAPGARPVGVRVPCHIIEEWHNGVGVTLRGSSAAIYRCQGRLWSVPLSDTEMLLVTTGTPQSDPPAALLSMSQFRQDLGPLTLAAEQLAMTMAGSPQRFVVGGIEPHHLATQALLAEGKVLSSVLGLDSPDSDTARDDFDDVDFESLATDFGVDNATHTAGRPRASATDPAAVLLSAFGATKEMITLDDEPLVPTNDGTETVIGYDLFGDSIDLQADSALNEWVLVHYRANEEGTDVDELHRWRSLARLDSAPPHVAAAVTRTLRAQAEHSDGDTQFAILTAQSVWGAVIGDIALTLEAWRAIVANHSDRFAHSNFNAVHSRFVEADSGTEAQHLELDTLFAQLPEAIDPTVT